MTGIAFIKCLFRTYIAMDNAWSPQEGCEPLHYSACLMGRCSGCSTWCHSFPPPAARARPPHPPICPLRPSGIGHTRTTPSVRPLYRNESNATLTANGARERRSWMLPSRPPSVPPRRRGDARPPARSAGRAQDGEGREGGDERVSELLKHFPQRSIARRRNSFSQSLTALPFETTARDRVRLAPLIICTTLSITKEEIPRSTLLERNSSYFGVLSSDSKCGKQSRSSGGRHGGLSHLRPTHLFTFGQSSPRGPFSPPDFSTNEKGPSPSSPLRTHALYLRLSSPANLRAPARHLLGKRPVGTRALPSREREREESGKGFLRMER